MAEQVRAVIAAVFLMSVLAMLAGVISPAIFLLPLMLMMIANREIGHFFYRNGGFLFACGALLFHQVYYLYSASAFAWVLLEQFASKVFPSRLSSS
jgi:hypothetical protein